MITTPIALPDRSSSSYRGKGAILDMSKDPNPLLKNTGSLVLLFDKETPLHPLAPVEWGGGKISVETWMRLTYFLQRAHMELGRESTVVLFYHKKRRKWTFSVPLQAATRGLAVYGVPREGEEFNQDNSPLVKKDLTKYLDRPSDHQKVQQNGWRMMGSVHHHCSAGPGQSGTDFEDEIEQPGLHITLGHLGTRRLSYDTRVTYRGIQYHVNMESFFEEPGLIEAMTFENPVPELEPGFQSAFKKVLKMEDIPDKPVPPVRWHNSPHQPVQYPGYYYQGYQATYEERDFFDAPPKNKRKRVVASAPSRPAAPKPYTTDPLERAARAETFKELILEAWEWVVRSNALQKSNPLFQSWWTLTLYQWNEGGMNCYLDDAYDFLLEKKGVFDMLVNATPDADIYEYLSTLEIGEIPLEIPLWARMDEKELDLTMRFLEINLEKTKEFSEQDSKIIGFPREASA